MSNLNAMTDLETLGSGMLAAVPFARTLGVEFVAASEDGSTVTVRMPDAAFGLNSTAPGVLPGGLGPHVRAYLPTRPAA